MYTGAPAQTATLEKRDGEDKEAAKNKRRREEVDGTILINYYSNGPINICQVIISLSLTILTGTYILKTIFGRVPVIVEALILLVVAAVSVAGQHKHIGVDSCMETNDRIMCH
jgi:hypothetical protein